MASGIRFDLYLFLKAPIYFSFRMHHTRRGQFSFLFRESAIMPLQKSPRYPLRSQDILINPDLLNSHKNSVSSRSRMLDGNPQAMMPSLVDPVAHTVSGYYHNDKSLLDDQPFANQKSYFDWQNFHDAAMLFQDPNHNGPVLNYPDSRFENIIMNPMPDHLVEQTIWDYKTSYNVLSSQPSSSMNIPRNLSCADDISMQDHIASVRPIRLKSSYLTEPEQQKLPLNLTYLRKLKVPVTSPKKGTLQPEIGESAHHIWCAEPKLSSLPTTKLEVLTVRSSDTNRESEDGTPLVNARDGESDVDVNENVEPYAQLIYRALREAPGYGMVLKDIYDWFEKNTDKAKNPLSKGWQNSIRHNLSMNGVSGQLLR